MFKDARDFQIAFLAVFLIVGLTIRDFSIQPVAAAVLIGSTLLAQYIANRMWKPANGSLRSAWITAISLCLLLRANSLWVLAAVGAVSIFSKFLIQYRGKHFFNPSNFGIVIALLFSNDAWVTPGQWGDEAWYAFLFLGTGAMIVRRVGRWDTTGAFFVSYALFEAARNAWLGWTWDVFLHRMMSGSLLLFAFFMITDPRAIPDNRRARVLWSILVAATAFILRNYFFIPTAVFWALFALSPLTVLFDLIWPAARFVWNIRTSRRSIEMMAIRTFLFLVALTFTTNAWSFCGFFVAKADAKMFNKASRVVIARDDGRTVLTMANDYQGEIKDFAIVVPVPVVLQKGQVRVADPTILDRLDAFSAPRLVEYFDPDPCMRVYPMAEAPMSAQKSAGSSRRGADALGVTVEAKFTVGEYDIMILSAKESSGLETWLIQNGYKLPAGARELLQPYIRQNMKFFVAKVNLAEFEKRGFQFLRPLQMAYESPKFMLPIRLGMVNAEAEQDLVAYMLSPKGRVEVTNYRTINIPSNIDIPGYIKNEFAPFYKSLFQQAYQREGKNVVFVEYAWDMNWCDPCAADPLTPNELRKAGVFWLDEPANQGITRPTPMPTGAVNVFITRLHVRYGRTKFPEDLVFQDTPNRENFQGRYVIRHPFKGKITCAEGKNYVQQLRVRQQRDAETLANVTGWDINDIRQKMGVIPVKGEKDESWWEKLFGEDD